MRAVEELKIRGSAGAVSFFAQHSAPIVRRPFYFSHNFAFLITVKLSICHIFVSDKYTTSRKSSHQIRDRCLKTAFTTILSHR